MTKKFKPSHAAQRPLKDTILGAQLQCIALAGIPLGTGKRKSAWLNSKAREVIEIKKLAFKTMKMHLSKEKKEFINSERINIKL